MQEAMKLPSAPKLEVPPTYDNLVPHELANLLPMIEGIKVLEDASGGENIEIISANFGTADFSNFEIISAGCPDIAPILFACRRSREGLGWKT